MDSQSTKSTMSSQSQAAMQMLTVPEGMDEDKSRAASFKDENDDADSFVSGISRNSGVSRNTETLGNSETLAPSESSGALSSFKLAAAETLMIMYSKAALLLVIAAVAVTVSFLTYVTVKTQEKNEYHAKFHDISSEIKEFSQLKALRVYDNLETFGATLTSYAMSAEYTWPFVVFPDFQVRGILSNHDTQAHTLSINPLVYPKDLDQWSDFTLNNQEWMAEAHMYDQTVHSELYEMESHESDYEHDQTVRWNETGVTGYVWKHDADDRYAKERVDQALVYTPIWQRAPPCDYATQINQDLRSDPTFTGHIDGMLAANHPVITAVVEATYLETNYEQRFNPKEYAEPHSYILTPVYDTLLENRTAVAFLSAFLRWGAFFTDVLPSSQHGIFVVLDSNCGGAFTYEIFGRKPVYIGEGNLHDTRVDDDPLVDHFEFSPESALGEIKGEIEFCHYYAHVYPSQEWREQFSSNAPYTYAATVMGCFMATALGFLVYDFLVQRRQNKVMQSAARTNKIVTSLFPANVRARLLEEADDVKGPKDFGANVFRNSGKKDNSLFAAESPSEAIFGSKPIADLFPNTTIMFGDMVGFTAWSSTREPIQVFTLLETVYHAFDMIAKRRRVFKVETIGDCYVAVTGLPVPRKDHASVMAKFANDCLSKMKELVQQLEITLGPETADLGLRIGLHSGPVTAGVLRGEKGRFQLFGDTMNTASRMESTGEAGRIHVSLETAQILMKFGKRKWLNEREDQIVAKGKGSLKTYWLKIQCGSVGTGTGTSVSDEDEEENGALRSILQPPPSKEFSQLSAMRKLGEKERRLVKWNVEILSGVLKQIMARRQSLGEVKQSRRESKQLRKKGGNILEEVKDVLALPQFDVESITNSVDPKSIKLSEKVTSQLLDVVARIASSYQANSFHSFEHASHVTMSVTKLLSRIVSPNDVKTEGRKDEAIAAKLHDHTFGITSDPLTQFACVIAALIHDADHPGVSNTTLVQEQSPLALRYGNKSVAEQNSVDLTWDILMSEEYSELQSCIYCNKQEFERFRSIVVNVVMATDIMDKDLGAQRKARWEKAFSGVKPDEERPIDPINRKATIVLEHLMQASDVSHTMQHWMVFQKWNERLFQEMYKAFQEGRTAQDPSKGWYQGELGFFDFYIIPLAKKLETCGVFGASSQEYLNYAQNNRREWESKGEQLVKDYLSNFHQMNMEVKMTEDQMKDVVDI